MISFVKAHACGNHFLIIDETYAGGRHAELARRLCQRNTGIGADGVEFVHGHELRVFNSDGSEAELSGNGTRCVAAWFAYEQNLDRVVLGTAAGLRSCRVVSKDDTRFEIECGMGVPEVRQRHVLLGDGRRVEGAVVNAGNPHYVVFLEAENWSWGGSDWTEVGAEICTSPLFPGGINVEFVRTRGHDEIEIRIYERGAGPTTSSGTGTTAAAAAAIALRGAAPVLRVSAPGGTQTVVWPGTGHELLLTGPAEIVCRGEAWL